MAPELQHRLQVVLPDDGTVRNSFYPTPAPDEQLAETETVTVLRTSASSGLEVAGTFDLAGGPAKLVRRGNKLYQVAAVGISDYRIREYPLGAAMVGQTPLRPAMVPSMLWTIA